MRFELPSAIGHCAFLNCYSLGRLTVPTAVTAIGFDAFALRPKTPAQLARKKSERNRASRERKKVNRRAPAPRGEARG